MRVRYLLSIHLSWSLPAVLWYKFGWVKLWRIAPDLPNSPKFSPTTVLRYMVFVERSLQSMSTWLLWVIVIITKVVYCSVFSILANVYTFENSWPIEISCQLSYWYNTICGPIGRHCSTRGVLHYFKCRRSTQKIWNFKEKFKGIEILKFKISGYFAN